MPMTHGVRIYCAMAAMAAAALCSSPAPHDDAREYSSSVNFSVDLAGTTDGRPTTWGSAGYIQQQIQFHPPAGYRVRVVRVYGDFVAWPREGVMAPGTYSEVGWGLKNTSPDGSSAVTYPAGGSAYDNSFVWVQNAVLAGNPNPRLSFDHDTRAGGLLGPDNLLISQTFVALNTSGLVMHSEPTFTVIYRYEREAGAAE